MESSIQKRVYSYWILVEPAEDVPGLWISHCLNLDVISQGETPQQAFEAVCEAVEMAVVDDLTEDLDPGGRAPAPQEYWDRLRKVLTLGTPVKLPDVPANTKVFLAQQVTFIAEIMRVRGPLTQSSPDFDPNFEPVSVVPLQLPVSAVGCQPSMS